MPEEIQLNEEEEADIQAAWDRIRADPANAEWMKRGQMVQETDAKLSRTKANYKPAFGSARCAACAHYREHACELVEGKIEPNDVCDLFTPQREDLTARISQQYAEKNRG